MRVYLIDDDAEEAELFNDAFLTINDSIEVRYFSDGQDALKVLASEEDKPRAIFLDLNMPIFPGKEVLKKLRSVPVTTSIPVIIYSTTISKRDIEDTSSYNVKYLQKPEDFKTLCKQLSSLITEL